MVEFYAGAVKLVVDLLLAFVLIFGAWLAMEFIAERVLEKQEQARRRAQEARKLAEYNRLARRYGRVVRK